MELAIEQELLRGVTAHREGKLKAAERHYRTILQSQPKHPHANHNLGVIAISMERFAAALPMFKTALEGNSQQEQFWLSYIDALIKENQFETATQVIQKGRLHGVAGEKLDALEEVLREFSHREFIKPSNKFFNEEFNAHNVVEFSFDEKILDGIKEIASSPLGRDDFYCARPKWSSNIQWESTNSFKSFKIFNDAFKKLIINDGMRLAREHIAHKEKIIMYSGFLVIRSECTAPTFHVDWNTECGTNAFTLITPLIQPSDGFNLLFKDNEGLERKYEYEFGKCIAFSSNFLHSTDVGTSSTPSVLLSMTFGTDRMEYWDAISKTAAEQGQMYRLPNGRFVHKNID